MRKIVSLAGVVLAAGLGLLNGGLLNGSSAQPAASDPVEAGRARFNVRCAGCHGQDGLGGERAPAIGHGSQQDLDNQKTLRNLIQHGISDRGMPAFTVPAPELDQLVAFVQSRVIPLEKTALSGNAEAGAALFFGKAGCSGCHMIWGKGSLNGPDLTEIAHKLTLAQVETALLRPASRPGGGYQLANLRLANGGTVRGFIRDESGTDLEVQSLDGGLHLLAKSQLTRIDRETKPTMPVWNGGPDGLRDLIKFLQAAPGRKPQSNATAPASAGGIAWQSIANPKPGDWPTYHGKLSGNRYSELAQIKPGNIRNLSPKWMFPVPGQGAQALEVTPVVADGVMYVTRVNTVIALDARSGRRIWQYSRPASKELVGDAAGGINRGVAVLGDRVFVVTDNAHLLALHRVNGALLWDSEMADSRKHYGATSAPLVVGDLVISGVSGGDEGIRGQLNAFRASTGEHVWRFWAIPEKSDGRDWVGKALEHGCGATWLTGTYDAGNDTLIWPIGNPCPDYNGDERKGDNLFTDSVVALEPKTGKLKWHYQFTPHDLHDWDATETPMLVDRTFQGQKRELLLQGNRNGFFYVLDRSNGKFLSANPFVKKLTWAKKIGPDGRPVLAEGWQPTVEGTEICPSVEGASNWMSSAYHPGTGLFYLLALEKCNVFTKNSEWWKRGQSFYGGTARPVDAESPRKYLRAIDPESGKIVWQHEQTGAGQTWGGLLATASGLIFYGDDDGSFGALDAKTGKPLWHFPLGAHWHASPMSYAVDGRQYVAVAVNSGIVAFGLVP
ncbi:MAG TPA: PQQ-binding-like beta-propeller repeat protein [Rhizomicrobium sp.]|nr:PQQ-binding-like beta-propeller repeat protein [Rhizomicrobium sp.]